MKKILTLIVIPILISSKSFSQNADIVYQNSSLSNINNCPQCCNVFNQSGNNPAVGGFSHFPVSGGAIFDGFSIKMKTQKSSSPVIDNGTAYAIGYTFKTGRNYTMTVDMGYSADTITAVPTLTLSARTSLPNSTDTDPFVCGPVSGSKYLSSIGGIIKVFSPTPKSTPTIETYNINQFTVPSQQSFLVITVSNGGKNGTTALINRITITETVAVPTITSSISSLTCGATTPATFTINNVGGITGITDYTWNLGTTPNGWLLPNGSPTPATHSTGTTNSLTLTPVCGSSLQNVSATVNTASNSFPTNNATVTISTPSLTISGNNFICTNPETYSVGSNLPCNSTVSWTVSPLGIVNLAPSGNSVILTKITDGTVTLTANVSAACGATVPALNKTINAQSTPPNPTAATLFNQQTRTGEKFAEYSITPNVAGATYIVTPSVQNFTFYFVFGNTVEVVYPCTSVPGFFEGTVKIQNGCGTSTGSVTINKSFSVCDDGGGRDKVMLVTSNPGMSATNVSVTEKESGKPIDIKWIQVLSKEGVLIKEYKYEKGTKQAMLNLSSLKKDVYIIRAFDGAVWISTKISIN